MKWQKKLTAAERKHLQGTLNMPTLEQFKLQRMIQKKMNLTCFECRHIALKLGIEE